MHFFGAIKNIFYTPYLHSSILLALFSVLLAPSTTYWTDLAIDIIPSMLGFSLGGYAIIIAFGDDKFREFLATTKIENKSLFMIINATFIHFIMSQVIALLLAILINISGCSALWLNIACCTATYYAILFCLAVALEIKTISKWYVSHKVMQTQQSPLPSESNE